MKRRVLLGIVIFVLAGTAIALGAVGILPGIFTEQKRPPEQEQAIEIGREYLEDIGRQPGKVFSVDLKIETKCLIVSYFTGNWRME